MIAFLAALAVLVPDGPPVAPSLALAGYSSNGVVFVDLAGVRRDGDAVAMSQYFIMAEPHEYDAADQTAWSEYNYLTGDCAAWQVVPRGFDALGRDGLTVVASSRTDQEPPIEVTEEMIMNGVLALACGEGEVEYRFNRAEAELFGRALIEAGFHQ